MQQNLSTLKWAAKISRKLEKCSADQIWPLFEDFLGHKKYFSIIPTCYGIQGINGEPGCIRYNTGFVIGPETSNDPVLWVKERLLVINKAEMTLTYDVVDSNIGFNSYIATFKVVPATPHDVVEWHFSLDPVEGVLFENLVKIYESWLKLIVDNMEETVSQQLMA